MILKTDLPDGLEGHGLTFTSGRGNELCVAAIEALAPFVAGRPLESFSADLGPTVACRGRRSCEESLVEMKQKVSRRVLAVLAGADK